MKKGKLNVHNAERKHAADFVRNFAVDDFKGPLSVLQDWWGEMNRDHFGGELVVPHLGIGPTSTRKMAVCAPTTDDGRLVKITINAGIILKPNPAWVANPWPSQGVQRLVKDLLLRCATRQHVLEQVGKEEPGHEGYGPLFADKANAISLSLGLGLVTPKHRGTETPDAAWPLARHWPVNVRLLKDPAYYGNDVRQALLDLAGGTVHAGRREPIPAYLGQTEYYLWLLNNGKQDRLRLILARHADHLQHSRERRLPVLRQAELGLVDINGALLGQVTFNPAWIQWNNATVRKMVETIHQYRAYAELPILADALEDAGCDDERILRHLRHNCEHTFRCWALQGLRALFSIYGK